MGYRSNVLIVYHGPKEVVKAFIVAAKFNGHGKAITEMTTKDCPDGFAIGTLFKGVKWYMDYLDVKMHEDLWYFAQEFENLSGSFCRTGEDDDDTERKSFGEASDPINVHRVIDCDYDF